jgi:uncharacterized protein
MKKVYYTWQDIENQTQEILRQIQRDAWQPDYVVGLTRGGLVPANLISQYLEVPMETLKVSLRDDNGQSESNLWMAEDAFGYDMDSAKNILIVDDINDSGHTLQWIRDDWRSGCLPGDKRWDTVWGYNVRVAVLINNQASEFKPVDYTGLNINKFEEPVWCVYPWEEWWK